jgi:DHA3 family tetracycline resistance protein-like MFS transporter
MLGALRGPFGLLWAGQSVSLLGDGVFLVAFTWEIAVYWGRPALLGLLLGARILVELIALGLGGWIIDRIPRRTTVLVADAGRAAILVALAAALHRPESTPQLALLVSAYGLLTGLFRPTLIAYVPEIIERELLPAANSLLSLSNQTAVMLGPAIGTALVGFGSAQTALRLDGLSFLLSALAVLPLKGRRPQSPSGGVLAQVAEGFSTVRKVGWLGRVILMFSIVNIGTITAERLALPRAAHERFGQLGGYGAILISIGAGAALAALLLAQAPPPRHPGRAAFGGLLLFAFALTSFGLARGVVAGVLLGLAFGFGQELCELLWTLGLQQNVPDRLLGRVSSVDQFGSFLFLPLSFAFGGLVVQAVHPEVVLVGAGALAALAAVLGLSLPVLNRWEPFTVDTPGEPRFVAAAGSPNGAGPNGATPIGTTPDGATPVGATPIGAIPVGAIPVGAMPTGATPNGAGPEGATPVVSAPGRSAGHDGAGAGASQGARRGAPADTPSQP